MIRTRLSETQLRTELAKLGCSQDDIQTIIFRAVRANQAITAPHPSDPERNLVVRHLRRIRVFHLID